MVRRTRKRARQAQHRPGANVERSEKRIRQQAGRGSRSAPAQAGRSAADQAASEMQQKDPDKSASVPNAQKQTACASARKYRNSIHHDDAAQSAAPRRQPSHPPPHLHGRAEAHEKNPAPPSPIPGTPPAG